VNDATGVIDIAAFLQALQEIGIVPHSGARLLDIYHGSPSGR
jgi:hypothetical protein